MPYKDIEKKRESGRNWQRKAYALNPEKFNEYCREWREKNKQYHINWKKRNPWVSVYADARDRCKPNKQYGLRGIKFNMTVDDFKFLWFRDNAFEMETPSIDRIDTKGDYILENCRFIEFEINNNRQKFTGWLKHGCCKKCKTTDREHHGRGYCQKCYDHIKKHFNKIGILILPFVNI